jgi:hypothetical protein
MFRKDMTFAVNITNTFRYFDEKTIFNPAHCGAFSI